MQVPPVDKSKSKGSNAGSGTTLTEPSSSKQSQQGPGSKTASAYSASGSAEASSRQGTGSTAYTARKANQHIADADYAHVNSRGIQKTNSDKAKEQVTGQKKSYLIHQGGQPDMESKPK